MDARSPRPKNQHISNTSGLWEVVKTASHRCFANSSKFTLWELCSCHMDQTSTTGLELDQRNQASTCTRTHGRRQQVWVRFHGPDLVARVQLWAGCSPVPFLQFGLEKGRYWSQNTELSHFFCFDREHIQPNHKIWACFQDRNTARKFLGNITFLACCLQPKQAK